MKGFKSTLVTNALTFFCALFALLLSCGIIWMDIPQTEDQKLFMALWVLVMLLLGLVSLLNMITLAFLKGILVLVGKFRHSKKDDS